MAWIFFFGKHKRLSILFLQEFGSASLFAPQKKINFSIGQVTAKLPRRKIKILSILRHLLLLENFGKIPAGSRISLQSHQASVGVVHNYVGQMGRHCKISSCYLENKKKLTKRERKRAREDSHFNLSFCS